MLNQKIILSSLTIFAIIWSIYQERLTIPSCDVVSSPIDHHPDDLTAVLVSNLLLVDSHASFRTFLRDLFLSNFFSKSFELLKPDMLIVLGDVSAMGYELTRKDWSSVLQRLESILGPYLQLPLHVTLGDRDIGECAKLKPGFVQRIASSFPDLDSVGCGSFEIGNVSFVSLNTVALLCGNNELLPDIERVVERESAYLRMRTEGANETIDKSYVTNEDSYEFQWKEHSASSQSGPVLLVHFPFQHVSEPHCRERNINLLRDSMRLLQSRVVENSGLYDLLHTVPPNATEYVLRALKPRMIFSAHSNKFCDITHQDGTREVTVPGLTWTAQNDPGFVVATFKTNGPLTVSPHLAWSSSPFRWIL
ncbi:uncharacterized protein LOC141596404 isoform X2 [Silene latifolia]|uniref:uncharacterized protein LOC141596404 isoform X2 n=1 Tax=Silene latifolia TaxID=37657 RepID=UPI003D788D3C